MKRILYTTPTLPSGKLIRAAAALGGISLELPAAYEHYVDNKKPEFLSKFPHGKIPALQEEDGFLLFEGIAIARYIARLAPNSSLLGHDTKQAAQIDQWMHLVETEVADNNTYIRGLILGVVKPYNKAAHTLFVDRQVRALRTLNTHLANRTFFVGERITLADIYVAIEVQRSATISFDAKLRKEMPHIVRHSETVLNQPQFKGIFETVEYVENALQYVPPPKAEKQ